MLRIRLFRIGKKNQPFFRIVVIEKKSPPRGGRPLEILGFLNPLTKEKNIKKERINYWLSVGAQPSNTVYNILASEGILTGKKKPVHKKSKKTKEAPKTAMAPKEEKEEIPKETKAEEPLKEKEPAKETKDKEETKEEKTSV